MNISNNDIGQVVLFEGWTKGKGRHKTLKTNKWYKHTDGREQKAHPGKPEGAIAIAGAISTNGALEKLLMGANSIKGGEAGKALGDAIAVNTVLKELDLSGGEYDNQKCDAEFAKGFSVGLGANGALTSLDISSNQLIPQPKYLGNDKYEDPDFSGE